MEAAAALKRLTEPSDSPDVTLALCMHHQNGFCKFGERCRKRHINDTCSSQICKSAVCTKRHPKVCKYFATFSTCKFGEHCAYKHMASSKQDTIDELTVKASTLETAVNELTQRIVSLEKEIKNLEKESKTSFLCEQCDYMASSNIVLKRHTTTKHKSSTTMAEAAAAGPHLMPQLDGHISDDEDNIKCNICNYEANSSSEFDSHIKKEHNGIPHTSQWEDNVCHFCNKSFNRFDFNLFDFKDHMTSVHNYTLDGDLCYNCDESPIVGRFVVCSDQRLTMLCTSCQAKEDEFYDT
jgi:hypothetical protein